MHPSRLVAKAALRALGRLSVCMAAALVAHPVTAQTTHAHGGSPDDHHPGPKFAHPLIAESPFADTQVRIDYIARHIGHEETGHAQRLMHLETEYALSDHVGIEVRLPYTITDAPGAETGLGVAATEVGLDLATSLVRRPNLLFRLGLEVGLLFGDYLHGPHTTVGAELEPYVTVAYRWRRLDVITFAVVGIPTERSEEGGRDAEVGYNLSLLYRLTNRLQGMAELHGGVEHGEGVAYATPGFKIRPLNSADVWIGLGASLPLAGHEEFEAQGIMSLFYHF